MEGSKTTDLAGDALREPLGSNARHALLFERVASRIYRYFAKTVWDPAEAEELAQRTLLELERSLREKSYDPARSFNSWMWLKAHTVFAQYCRERETKKKEPLGDAPARRDDAAEVDARLDAAAILRRVQERLGDEAYEIFVLFYEGGLTHSEIAEAVGRDRKTVAGRLREANAFAQQLITGART